jgi:hypothetical protein
MAFPAGTTLDAFTGTNGDDLPAYSANWSPLLAGAVANLEIQDNAATGVGNGVNSGNYWDTQTFGPHCDFSILVTTKVASGGSVGVMARMVDPAVTADFDGYMVRGNNVGAGTDTIQIRRWDGAVSTLLGVGFSQEYSAGDSIGIRCEGDQISAYYHNGTSWSLLGTETDATYGAAGYAGLIILDLANTCRLDNFGGGTLPFIKMVGNNFRLAGAGGLAS